MSGAEATTLAAEVERALEGVRGRLRGHGGDASVGVAEDGDVDVSWHGACRGCPALALTFGAVVAPAIRAVPGVRTVRSGRVMVSAGALRRLEDLTARYAGPERLRRPAGERSERAR
jgi:Fe-S cluster biogenesis protein NfuA